MKKKATKKMLGLTLEEFEFVPVAAPEEIRALDCRCRAAERASATAERKAGKRNSPKGVKPGTKKRR
jgi:hypothetical protein